MLIDFHHPSPHVNRAWAAALLILLMGSLIFGCANSRPVLADNETFHKNGEVQAAADIEECMVKAENYLAAYEVEMASPAAPVGKPRPAPDEIKQTYVTNCLIAKDYEVVGWK